MLGSTVVFDPSKQSPNLIDVATRSCVDWGSCPEQMSVIGTPPSPPVNVWTVAPPNQTEAERLVQDISNQALINQQAANSRNVDYVSQWLPSFLIPNPSTSSGDGSGSSSIWSSIGSIIVFTAGIFLALDLFGGRK
jgi:hypothetical protein